MQRFTTLLLSLGERKYSHCRLWVSAPGISSSDATAVGWPQWGIEHGCEPVTIILTGYLRLVSRTLFTGETNYPCLSQTPRQWSKHAGFSTWVCPKWSIHKSSDPSQFSPLSGKGVPNFSTRPNLTSAWVSHYIPSHGSPGVSSQKP